MSTTFSNNPGPTSHFPLPLESVHSKLLFVESDIFSVILLVSLPVMVNGLANWPVTTQDPGGIGDVDANGLGTVVPAL
jgi:hypothetical protein